jgi:hypothetical protein
MDWSKTCERMQAAAKLLGIDTVVKVKTSGPHKACVFWNGERYEIWLRPSGFDMVSDYAHELAHVSLGHAPKTRLVPEDVRKFLSRSNGTASEDFEIRERQADAAAKVILQFFRRKGVKF